MADEYSERIVTLLDKAVTDFHNALPGIQQQVADNIEEIMSGLDKDKAGVVMHDHLIPAIRRSPLLRDLLVEEPKAESLLLRQQAAEQRDADAGAREQLNQRELGRRFTGGVTVLDSRASRSAIAPTVAPSASPSTLRIRYCG